MSDGGLLFSIARTLLGLVGVCALAWVALHLLARRGIGMGKPNARLQLLERLELGPRRQLYLVQADARVLLLSAADGGGLSLITELAAPAASTLLAGATRERPKVGEAGSGARSRSADAGH